MEPKLLHNTTFSEHSDGIGKQKVAMILIITTVTVVAIVMATVMVFIMVIRRALIVSCVLRTLRSSTA